MSLVEALQKEVHIKHPVKNINAKYRFETMIIDESIPHYPIEKSFVRETEVNFITKVGNLFRYQVLCFNTTQECNRSVESAFIVRRNSYIFDELKISADEEGNIVKLHNLEDVQKRWAKTKTELQKDCSGAAVEQYFSYLSELLNHKEKVIAFLRSNKMLGLYFNGKMGLYGSDNQRINALNFANGNSIQETTIATEADGITTLSITGKRQDEDEACYTGNAIYKNNVLIEADLEKKNNLTTTKYNALWVG